MKNKFVIFLLSVLVLFGFIFIALFASMVFSIKKVTAPIQLAGSNNIAVLEISGIILNSEKFLEKVKDIEEQDEIKAVVIRIDSPGGAVGPSQEIYSEILKLKKKKPVFASLAAVAASGGYYVASACDKIYSNPGTLTGSIGVIMNFVNIEKMYEFLKMKSFVIKSGKFKDTGSGLRKMTEEEKSLMQNVINDTFQQFTRAILKTRKLSKKSLKLISDGRIMTGLQAQKLGLVDEMGTLNDVIDALAKKTDIKDKPNIVYPLRKKEKLIDYLKDFSLYGVFNNLKEQLKGPALYYLSDTLFEVNYANR